MNSLSRFNRLKNDYEQLVALHNRNGLINVIAVEGNPPEHYMIGYRCRGVAEVDSKGRPRFIEDHRVEIVLTVDYPRVRPLAFWKTTIFHPNFRNGEICWEWYPQQSLRETCEVFAEMVQYKNYNSTSPLNMDASMWAMKHGAELPVDSRSLFEAPAGQSAPREIGTSFYTSSAVIIGNVSLQMPSLQLPETTLSQQNGPPAPFCGACGYEFTNEQSLFCPRCGEARYKVSQVD
jgi:ubiquitin-protein ligase